MALKVEAKFSREDVDKRFRAFLEEIKEKQIERAKRLGEMCVNHARNIPPQQGFQDQTGNLRSSIGYMLFVDGVAIHTAFKPVGGGTDGAKIGEALARKIGSEQKGVCLIVVAGMNYALYVESSGRDVLTSAEQLAERELPKMLEKLINNIKRAAE